MTVQGKCGACGHRWEEHRRIDAEAGDALNRSTCEGRTSRYRSDTMAWIEEPCGCVRIVPKAAIVRGKVRAGAWLDRATNTILCDDEGTILARGVGDGTALATARAHVSETGHRVYRQRTRVQPIGPRP